MVAGALSGAQTRRAVTCHRRIVRSELAEQIDEHERSLWPLVSGWLPVEVPRPGTPEVELSRLLRDDRGRSLRIFDTPVLQCAAGVSLDELVDELARQATVGGFDPRPEVLIEDLAARIRHVRQLRGRGGRYGAIRNGLELRVVTQLAHDAVDHWLAMGQLTETAGSLRRQIADQLSRPAESGQTRMLRRLYFRLADAGAVDSEFAEIFSHAPLVELVMAETRRPRWCSWRRLAADYLGILPNSDPALPVPATGRIRVDAA